VKQQQGCLGEADGACWGMMGPGEESEGVWALAFWGGRGGGEGEGRGRGGEEGSRRYENRKKKEDKANKSGRRRAFTLTCPYRPKQKHKIIRKYKNTVNKRQRLPSAHVDGALPAHRKVR
jgi:hypothetical protein